VDTWRQSPNYLAFKLVTALQGGRPFLVSDLEGPSFDVAKESELPGFRNVPVISAYASGDPLTGKAWVLLVNRNLQRSIKCRMSLDMQWLTAPELSVRRIQFDSLLSTNLADEDVTSPLPTPGSKRSVDATGFSVTLDRAGVVLLTLESRGVT